jgi:hypothetical protein
MHGKAELDLRDDALLPFLAGIVRREDEDLLGRGLVPELAWSRKG